MKILLTGGAGFIGSHILKAYLEAGHEVVVIDDLSRGRRQAVPEGVPLYQVDICDVQELEALMARERPEVVNHHAGLVSVRESQRIPDRYRQVNVQGTVNVVEVALEVGIKKFIFASSGGAIYGQAPAQLIGEDAPLNPISIYGETKVLAERLIPAQDGNFEAVILRYGNVYGPGQDPTLDNGVIAIFSHALLLRRRPLIYGEGDQQRDYVYVEDVARANCMALQPGLHGIFNVATGTGRSLMQVYQGIAEVLETDLSPRFIPANSFEVRHNVLDARRARDVLGWEARVPFKMGLERTVRAIQAQVDQGRKLAEEQREAGS